MSRIIYLACSAEAIGIADAAARQAERIGRLRFALPNKDDLRVVRNFNEMVPMAGKTPLIRGSDYDAMPDSDNEMVLERWQENHDAFERFVADGYGEWVEG